MAGQTITRSWSPSRMELVITVNGRSTTYRVTEIGSDYGRGFRLKKIATTERQGELSLDTYCVHVSGDGMQSCECVGFLRYQTCRHCEAMRRLIDTGIIPGGYPADGADEAMADPEWASA